VDERNDSGAASPDERDGEVDFSQKSEWMERSASAAGDPVDDAELAGHDMIARAKLRDGALDGSSVPQAGEPGPNRVDTRASAGRGNIQVDPSISIDRDADGR
jgi:hypothetical protein